MAQTRPATPAAGVIALILLGGAVATGVAAIMMFGLLHQSDVLFSFRRSTGYYVLSCALVGFFTAAGVLLTRPRGPLAPLAAAVAAFVALYAGIRIGVLVHELPGGLPGGTFLTQLMKYRFDVEDLVVPVVPAAVAGLRVATAAKSLAPTRPSGPPSPQPGAGAPPYPGQPPYP